jgi:hypothetical protein
MGQLAPWLGALLVVAGIVALRRAAGAAARLPPGQKPDAYRAAFVLILLGVTVLVSWWTVFLQPDDFPWLAVSAALGLTALGLLIARSRVTRR